MRKKNLELKNDEKLDEKKDFLGLSDNKKEATKTRFTKVNSHKKNLAESRNKRKWDVVQKKIKLSAKCRNKQERRRKRKEMKQTWKLLLSETQTGEKTLL